MARGKKSNSKSIEEHQKDGTYIPSRHGLIATKSDYDRISEMKDSLYAAFNNIKTKLEATDINTEPDKYKMLNAVMGDQIKTYISITRNKVINEDGGDQKENGKIQIS